VAGDTEQPPPLSPTGVRTFLIADVRGYTRFTREHGDEAASELTAWFAEVARSMAPEFSGELLELRGDEALCVFGSARQALRAAVELQRRLRTPSGEDGRVFPVGVGVGLDAGEAVATDGGYRGGALNLAARLCSVAAPGQVLASEGVVHLSQRVDGVRFSTVRTRRFKGIEAPVRLVEVIPETPLPDVPVAPVVKRRRFSKQTVRLAAGAAVFAVAAAVAIGVMFVRGSGASSVGLASNSFSLVGANGHVSAPLALDESPFGVAVAGKVAWLPRYSSDAVLAVDTATGQQQSVQVGDGPDAVAVGAGSVWVANAGDGTVSEVNPSAQRVVGVPIYVGNGPTGIAVGGGAVWVALSLDGAVAKIDPHTDRVVKTFSVGTNPTRVAFGFGKVWVTNESVGTVTPIDPARGVAESPIAVGRGPNGLAVDAGAVWVSNSLDGTVSRLDPSTLAVTASRVGDDPQGITVVGDTVWVAARRSAEMVRLDARTGQVVSRLAVGANPQDVTALGDRAAITTTTSPTEHRGGTLTIAGASTDGLRGRPSVDPDSDDAWYPVVWDSLAVTNDGLVSLKRVPGPDGGTVVADLAKALPTVTDGGLTYAFQLREGIRYSTGRPVRASDIRHGLERTFVVNPAAPPDGSMGVFYYSAVVGTPRCAASPRSCDLSRGIVTDDKSGRITFHLRHPDPDFLAKLAMPPGVAMPREAPRYDSGRHPLPATGPYMIARYGLRQYVLVRNPYFHEWSPDAQPDGYPDRIVWRVYKKTSQAVSAVEHGAADWLYFTIPPIDPQQIHEIETDYAAQTHPSAYPSSDMLIIEPNSPLSRDHTARRAIAYAIDRERLHRILTSGGSSLPARSTCQLLPPNFPGYRPYCPYPLEPGFARKLVRSSPSYGNRVSILSYDGSTTGRYFVDLLNSLGFRARPTALDERGEPREAPDIVIGPWVADYVGASDFILAIRPGLITRSDLAHAYAKQSESQYKGTRAWAAADKHLTDDALIIPIGTGSTFGFTSKRVGNYQTAPAPGNSPMIDQMWVR
jgi:ABC-type transport system substrate-binding protein/class 3 adenylate cyclase